MAGVRPLAVKAMGWGRRQRCNPDRFGFPRGHAVRQKGFFGFRTGDVVRAVVEAVGDRTELLFDGGIRRGTDVVKALALGARACMIGRPYLYGLGAAGQAGVEHAIRLLRAEIDRAQALLGRPTLADLDRRTVRLPTTWLRD